jgi:effector-binding domain-containing protein
VPLPISEVPRSEVEWIEFDDVATAAIRFDQITQATLIEVFDKGFGTLGAAADAGAFVPAGPAVAVYHGDPMAVFDLEVALPVAVPLANEVEFANHRLRPSVVRGGRCAVRSHVGAYDGLGDAWQSVVAAVLASGAVLSDRWIEVYVTEPGPDVDPATLRTELIAPVG